jgi:hypothetical protein
MNGTNSYYHKLTVYQSSFNSRNRPNRIIFHLLLATVLNAHILYKLKNLIHAGDYFYHLGGWIEEAAR